MKHALAAIALLTASVSAFADVETYNIDPSHSFANFAIRHVVSKTSGTLTDIKGTLLIDPKNLANSSVNARINVLSINTTNAKRDEHIQKPEYLDTAKYNEITFVSTKITPVNASEGTVTGNFTMHGITKEISFPFIVLGFGKDPWGGIRTGIEAKTVIKASDYGYNWGTKTGSPIGDDIEILLLIEGIQATPDAIKVGK